MHTRAGSGLSEFARLPSLFRLYQSASALRCYCVSRSASGLPQDITGGCRRAVRFYKLLRLLPMIAARLSPALPSLLGGCPYGYFQRRRCRPTSSVTIPGFGSAADAGVLATLGTRRARVGILKTMLDRDSNEHVREKVTFALSVSKEPSALGQLPHDEGIPLLIQLARSNANREVRKQAMFWLGKARTSAPLSFSKRCRRSSDGCDGCHGLTRTPASL